MKITTAVFRRLPLRSLLTAFLVGYGILPVTIGAFYVIREHRDVLETQERVNLTNRVEALSGDVAERLTVARQRLTQLAVGLSAIPAVGIDRASREEWINGYLKDFVLHNDDLLDTRVTFVEEQREFAATRVGPAEVAAVDEVLLQALETEMPKVRFVRLSKGGHPAAIVVERIARPTENRSLILGALVELPIRMDGEAQALLIDGTGNVLWTAGANVTSTQELVESTLVEDFLRHPAIFVAEYELRAGYRTRHVIAQVSPVRGSDWGIVVQQPMAAVFGAARRIAKTTLISAGLMVLLAIIFSFVAGHYVTAPIQRLALRSTEIASAKFGGRVKIAGVGREIVNLAESFNLMSGRLEEHVEKLRRAAKENHELFIGSIRALLAAVEAKEPYIRGHSERVAGLSRIIARHLGQPPEELDRVWVSGLLHDLGKIGIEDRVLNKGDILTSEEFDKMKSHTVIGAEIMSSIEQLKYSVDVLRSHHERWNGSGYPDGLHGTSIPLMARIVAVADSFDAMTTQRVYQDPMTGEQAAAWIASEAANSFDPNVVTAFQQAVAAGEVQPPTVESPQEPAMALQSRFHT